MYATSWTIFRYDPELRIDFQNLVDLVNIWSIVRLYLLESLEFFEKVLSSLVSVCQMSLKVNGINLKDLDGHATVTIWPCITPRSRLANGMLDIAWKT